MEQKYLLAASYLFERERGIELDADALAEIDAENLSDSDVAEVAEKIKSLLAFGNLSNEDRTVGYFALGKRFDARLISYFQNQLQKEVDSNPSAVYQLLISLDNLEEPVFGIDRDGSYSSSETELNIRDARRYLRRVMQ